MFAVTFQVEACLGLCGAVVLQTGGESCCDDENFDGEFDGGTRMTSNRRIFAHFDNVRTKFCIFWVYGVWFYMENTKIVLVT